MINWLIKKWQKGKSSDEQIKQNDEMEENKMVKQDRWIVLKYQPAIPEELKDGTYKVKIKDNKIIELLK